MDFSEPEITTLHAVARFFSCELVPDDGGYRYRLAVCEAFSLVVRKDYQTKKARFTAILPVGIPVLGSVDGVNVSLKRPALAIAKDIQRRLIPNAAQWAQRCRDHTTKLKREKLAEAEFLARIFVANRCEPTSWGHRDGWMGKGIEIANHNARLSHWGEYIATVKVRSIQALEQIAAICAEDAEFHTRKKEAAAKSPSPNK